MAAKERDAPARRAVVGLRVRLTTAFNRILQLPGASVHTAAFTDQGLIIGLRRRRRGRLLCPGGATTRARYDSSRRRTVHRSDADEYADYIQETGFAEYGQTPGSRGVSLWDSEDAIRALRRRRHRGRGLYPEDERYLIGGTSAVAHYDVVREVTP